MAAGEIAGVGELDVQRLHKRKREESLPWWRRLGADQLQAFKPGSPIRIDSISGPAVRGREQAVQIWAFNNRIKVVCSKVVIKQMPLPQVPQHWGSEQTIGGDHSSNAAQGVEWKWLVLGE
jgi:hypothetical protein